MLHVSRSFNVEVHGQRLKVVECERCGIRFYYSLTRFGKGSDESPYFIGQAAALENATEIARADLDGRLDREDELVPCPSCHWVNRALVAGYRRSQYQSMLYLAVPIAIAGMVIHLHLHDAVEREFGVGSFADSWLLPGIVVLGFASPVWLWLLRWRLRRRIDPNRLYPQLLPLPAGTPSALIELREQGAHEITLKPVKAIRDCALSQGDWIYLLRTELRFPDVCCVCDEPATTVFRTPFTVAPNSEVAVPLCRPCATRLALKWWLTAFVVAISAVGIAAFLALGPRRVDAFGRWFAFGLSATILVPTAIAVVPGLFTRPYRLTLLDRSRGIVRFRSTNPRFNQRMRERN